MQIWKIDVCACVYEEIDHLCWEKRSDAAGINPKAIIADPNTFMI